MKTRSNLIRFKTIFLLFLNLAIVVSLYSCKSDKKQNKNEDPNILKENAINILTENMDFQMADTISSGWNTFKYKNASTQTHFFLIDKYPEGITLDSVKARVLPPFDKGMKVCIACHTPVKNRDWVFTEPASLP